MRKVSRKSWRNRLTVRGVPFRAKRDNLFPLPSISFGAPAPQTEGKGKEGRRGEKPHTSRKKGALNVGVQMANLPPRPKLHFLSQYER